MKQLTKLQRRTLAFIRKQCAAGIPPTRREMRDALGVSHTAIQKRVKRLIEKGYIKKGKPHAARSLSIVRPPRGIALTTLEQLSETDEQQHLSTER